MKEKRFPCCLFTIEEEKQIIKDYQSGLSLEKTGKKWNCSLSTVQNILIVYGIPRRTLSQARRNVIGYTIHEDIFENIDTPEKAYWLGVMYSDGYISKAKYTNKFGISVAVRDKEWLEKFKKFLGYNGEVKEYEEKSGYGVGTIYARLLIGNNKIVSDLEKWGVKEHKSKILEKVPNISFKEDFIRGYIDGDGSLRKAYPNISVCGTKEFLTSVAECLQVKYSIAPDKTIFSLRYNTKESIFLEKLLYKNATIYLDRKYEIAKRSFDSPITLESVMKKV